jgi:ATP adenylyltransferase
MERLWSPWRLDYVTGVSAESSRGDCVFCDALVGPEPESLIVTRGHTCYVILNLFPYNNGHLMVVPNRHVGSLAEATRQESTELMMLTRRAEVALTEAYRPHGMNMGINVGRPAGAGVPGHLHMHLVPRWDGDTNFMTVVGSTRVVPEEPPQTLARLTPIFERLAREDD